MAIAMGLFMVLLLGMAVLALDIGRMMVIEVQMQNAAASQLTGADGSRVLAEAVARNAAQQTTSFLEGTTQYTILPGNSGPPATTGILFYQSWTLGAPGSGTLATADSNAVIVRVQMQSETLTLVLRPILDILTGLTTSGTTVHSAYAVAQNAPSGCEMPPLMICNPFEDTVSPPCEGTPSANINGPEHIGKMAVIKEGPGGVGSAPGEFGLLCTADGQCGANAIGDALADPDYVPACEDTTVQTSPGSKTNKIVWGINVRFDQSPNPGPGPPNDPAPNIFDYGPDIPIDNTLILQNGQWNPKDYLSNTYPVGGGGAPLHRQPRRARPATPTAKATSTKSTIPPATRCTCGRSACPSR